MDLRVQQKKAACSGSLKEKWNWEFTGRRRISRKELHRDNNLEMPGFIC